MWEWNKVVLVGEQVGEEEWMWIFNDHFQKNEGFSCSGKVDAANELALLYFKHLKKLKKGKNQCTL